MLRSPPEVLEQVDRVLYVEERRPQRLVALQEAIGQDVAAGRGRSPGGLRRRPLEEAIRGRRFGDLGLEALRGCGSVLERLGGIPVTEPLGQPRPVVRELPQRRVELAVAAVLGRMEERGVGDRRRLLAGTVRGGGLST